MPKLNSLHKLYISFLPGVLGTPVRFLFCLSLTRQLIILYPQCNAFTVAKIKQREPLLFDT